MNYIIKIVILVLFSCSLHSQSAWTIMKIKDFLPDSCTLQSHGFSIFENKFAIGRFHANPVLCFYENESWSFLYEEGLNSRCIDSNKFESSFVMNVEFDSKGNLWGIVSSGSAIQIKGCIFKYNGDSIKVYSHFYDYNSDTAIKIFSTYYIKNDLYDRPFVYVQNYTHADEFFILKYDTFRDAFYIFKSLKMQPVKNSEKDLAIDDKNRLWMIYKDTLYTYHQNNLVRKLSITDIFEDSGIITHLCISNKNVVYMLTSNACVLIYDGYSWLYNDYPLLVLKKEFPELKEVAISTMCTDSLNNLWVHISCSDILFKRDTNGKWTKYKIPTAEDTTINWYIKTIEADEQGRIWLLAQNYALYIFDPQKATDVEEIDDIQTELLATVWIKKLYPNPAIGKVSIEVHIDKDILNDTKVELYNIYGEKLKDLKEYLNYEEYKMNGKIEFYVNDLTRGVYIIKVGNQIQKFVKI